MKITPEILSIPPFISTKWSNVSSIRVDASKGLLIITLADGSQVEIPNLEQRYIDEIFQVHAQHSEKDANPGKGLFDNAFSFSLPMKADGGMLDPLSSQLQHNPDQSELPLLPANVLEKITGIVKSLGLEDLSILGTPEPNCNCIYCQLTRSLGQVEEVVDDVDLTFRDWEVTEKENNLFRVVSPLDSNEHYDVFLGEPLGCTCGEKNCEHIRAVLNT